MTRQQHYMVEKDNYPDTGQTTHTSGYMTVNTPHSTIVKKLGFLGPGNAGLFKGLIRKKLGL